MEYRPRAAVSFRGPPKKTYFIAEMCSSGAQLEPPEGNVDPFPGPRGGSMAHGPSLCMGNALAFKLP